MGERECDGRPIEEGNREQEEEKEGQEGGRTEEGRRPEFVVRINHRKANKN